MTGARNHEQAIRNGQRTLAVLLGVALAIPLAVAVSVQAPHLEPAVTRCKSGGQRTNYGTAGETIRYTEAEYEACVTYNPNTDQCQPSLRVKAAGAWYPAPYRWSWEASWTAPDEEFHWKRNIIPNEQYPDERRDGDWYDPPVTATVELSFMRQEVQETRQALNDRARVNETLTADCPTDAEWGGDDHMSGSDTLLRRCLPAVGCYHVQ